MKTPYSVSLREKEDVHVINYMISHGNIGNENELTKKSLHLTASVMDNLEEFLSIQKSKETR